MSERETTHQVSFEVEIVWEKVLDAYFPERVCAGGKFDIPWKSLPEEVREEIWKARPRHKREDCPPDFSNEVEKHDEYGKP